VAADLSLPRRAAGAFREAMAWLRTGPAHPGLELFLRYNLARLHAEQGRFLQAEDEIRNAEELAIKANRVRNLVQLYTLLGSVRGQQEDEGGFVFFEQAIQLARTVESSPILESRVYRDYGEFMKRLNRREEARACFTHARDLLASLGTSADLRQVEGELLALTA
jgi:tetratricopeptide (TPR) repeat protein